jgi:hypothetical protein
MGGERTLERTDRERTMTEKRFSYVFPTLSKYFVLSNLVHGVGFVTCRPRKRLPPRQPCKKFSVT